MIPNFHNWTTPTNYSRGIVLLLCDKKKKEKKETILKIAKNKSQLHSNYLKINLIYVFVCYMYNALSTINKI